MSKYDVIAFDLDGTLTDPSPGLVEGFLYCFKKLMIDAGDRDSLRRYIGPSLFDLWQVDFGFTPDEANYAIEVFREYYNIYGWWDNKLYDGIHETLERLRAGGKKLVLATSKPEDTAKKVMRLFGLDKYFDFLGGAGSHQKDQKWEVLAYSLSSIGIDTDNKEELSRCILVGDRCYDAEGAAKCGIDSMGVLYGHGTPQEIEKSGFTLIAETVSDIADILLK